MLRAFSNIGWTPAARLRITTQNIFITGFKGNIVLIFTHRIYLHLCVHIFKSFCSHLTKLELFFTPLFEKLNWIASWSHEKNTASEMSEKFALHFWRKRYILKIAVFGNYFKNRKKFKLHCPIVHPERNVFLHFTYTPTIYSHPYPPTPSHTSTLTHTHPHPASDTQTETKRLFLSPEIYVWVMLTAVHTYIYIYTRVHAYIY